MTTTIPDAFAEAFDDDDDAQAVEVAYYMACLDLMQQRIWSGDCVVPCCEAVGTPGGLTCGDHECKLWIGHMPDTLRAYLTEEKYQAIASETVARPVQWSGALLAAGALLAVTGGIFGAGWMVLAGQVGIAWVTR